MKEFLIILLGVLCLFSFVITAAVVIALFYVRHGGEITLRYDEDDDELDVSNVRDDG